MRRAPLLSGAAALALAAVLGLAVGPSGADDGADPQAAWMTAREAEALATLGKNKPVTARRLAGELLAEEPDSIVGHYVIGQVLHETEGNLPRAMFHLGRARELFEERYPRPAEGPWRFHRELLYAIQALAAQLEEHEYQLQILEYHDALYPSALVGERAWPLLKLGRLDEARAVAETAAGMREGRQRSLGLNALCAIESARRDRAAALAACRAAFEHARDQEAGLPTGEGAEPSTLAVHAYNAALAARAAFAPEEAERIALEGTKRLAFTPANPWRLLVGLYLDQGRGADAAGALREMQRWRVRQPPELRDQDRAETDVAIATAFLLAGRTGPALRLVDRALDRPDRRGLTSARAWQAQGAHLLLRRALRRADAERRDELESAGGGADGLGWLAGFDEWADDERIRGLFDDDERLIESFTVHGERGLTPVPTWLLGDLVEVLGPGTTAVVLKRTGARDAGPELAPYLEAIQVEVDVARGRNEAAGRRAALVLGALPASEALLRARVAALASIAARRRGDRARELELLEQAYTLDPSVIRRLGLALPAQIRVSGGPAAEEVARRLARSPRLRIGGGAGFQVDVAAAGDALAICLRGPMGAELTCTAAEPEAAPVAGPPGAVGAPAAAPPAPPAPPSPADHAERFHRQAFAMRLGLTGVDMSSLDGTTSVSERATREQIEKTLDVLTREGEE